MLNGYTYLSVHMWVSWYYDAQSLIFDWLKQIVGHACAEKSTSKI